MTYKFCKGEGGILLSNWGDEEDIIQEGMIGLYKAIRDFGATNWPFRRCRARITRQIITAIGQPNETLR